ncbi:MAG: F0F1 ATP synthase subunit A [Anaerolineales bacterium]|nr:F0F1 ATP synthase subunit A [Anaerolineales bacterium]MDW8160578.1 FoF1 ATP synthase subunit a [Anaerolineales bacterium]
MSEQPTQKRFNLRTLIIYLCIGAGIYSAFIGPSILKPISPVVVLPAEPTGLAIGGFQITNTILATLLADVILLAIAVFVVGRFMRSGNLVPSGFYNAFEALIEFLWNTVENAAGKWAYRIFPVPATIFLLIFVANLIKLVPGFESIGRIKEVHHGYGYAPVLLAKVGGLSIYTIDKGQRREHVAKEGKEGKEGGHGASHEEESKLCEACEIVPFLRGSATDLNFPFALAFVAVLMTQVYGVWALGIGYFEKFIPIRQLIKGGAMGVINFIVGILELILEFAKILSFGFRLFGNIFAGTLLLSIVGALTAVIVPVGLYFFEVFFGIIQAYVFYLLATIFISSATVSHHAEGAH